MMEEDKLNVKMNWGNSHQNAEGGSKSQQTQSSPKYLDNWKEERNQSHAMFEWARPELNLPR